MKAHIKVVSKEKKRILRACLVEASSKLISKRLVKRQLSKPISRPLKGFQRVNEKMKPVKAVSEATVDLGHVVEAIKKIEEEGQGVSEEVKAEILKMKSTPARFWKKQAIFQF